MRLLLRPLCWMNELLDTIAYGVPISGHDFIEVSEHPQVLRCKICGYESKEKV